MSMIYLVAAVVFFLALAIVTVVAVHLRMKLAKYDSISDIETYRNQCQEQVNELKLSSESYSKEIAKQKQTFAQYSQALGICKTTAELNERLSQMQREYERHRALVGEAKRIEELHEKVSLLKRQLALYTEAIGHASTAAEYKAKADSLRQEVAYLEGQITTLEQAADLQEFGIHQRKFDYDQPEDFKTAIDHLVGLSKEMVKSGAACCCEIEWVVEGSKHKGKQMVKEQIKLMLRAFNGECDAAIAKAKHNNLQVIQNRIRRCFEQLNKLGSTKKIIISEAYLQLRLSELELTHQYELAKEIAREKQREIKDAMAEEARAEREIEEAKRKAEKEEQDKARALEEARRQLADEHGKHNEKLAQLVSKLELELKEALDRKAKAIARAQLTKSGHVYVLSNIGTLGDGRYKIGMTRRLVPDERVKELGDASVPFPFDVHAMIYSEDAPALEHALHKHFDSRRMNLVNCRKEFFEVSLEEIIEAVGRLHGTITFVTEPPAEQFRESIKLRAIAASGCECEEAAATEPVDAAVVA